MIPQLASAGRVAPARPGQPLLAPATPQLLTPAPSRLPQQPALGPVPALRRSLPSHTACRATSVGRQAVEQGPQLARQEQQTESLALSSIDDTGPVYEGIIDDVPPRPTGLFVRVRNMVKHFATTKGLFRAVDGVDVDIEPSSIVALLGPSGSGKTTLLRLIAGLEQPTAGSILFDDEDATDLSVQDRQIGFVFQNYALFNHMTVAENIKFGLQVRRLNIHHDKRVADLLALVQLQGLGDRYPRQLSGGQRQRVAMARALASNPRLLLLDEPFGALDAVVRKQLRTGLREIVRSVGVTTIIVTHDQEEAFDLADKVVVFNRGLVEQQGKPTDIIKHPRTPFIMKFVGETNVVPATSLLAKRMRFSTPKSLLMFRPHDIKLFRSPPPQAPPAPAPSSSSSPALVDGPGADGTGPSSTSSTGGGPNTNTGSSSSSGTAPAPLTTVAATVVDKANLGWTIKYTLRFDDDVECELQLTRDQDDRDYSLQLGSRVFVHVPPRAMMGFNPPEVDSAPLV